MRESFGALREREFRLLFTGQLISLLGDAFSSVALAFAVLSIGTASDLGYVFAARSVPLVTFLLVGGVFADRLPRRIVMLTADVIRFGTQGGTGRSDPHPLGARVGDRGAAGDSRARRARSSTRPRQG